MRESYEISKILENADKQIRIGNLKDCIEKLTGRKIIAWESKDNPGDSELFWQRVLQYEQAAYTTYRKQLLQAGFELPAPEEVDDEEVNKKLWELIEKLAQMRVFLENTDHLSDRELYVRLYSDILDEDVKTVSLSPHAATHLNLVGSGSEEDIELYLKFYADEKHREFWHEDFPDDPMPARENPPYNRDSSLPRPKGMK